VIVTCLLVEMQAIGVENNCVKNEVEGSSNTHSPTHPHTHPPTHTHTHTHTHTVLRSHEPFFLFLRKENPLKNRTWTTAQKITWIYNVVAMVLLFQTVYFLWWLPWNFPNA